VRNLRRTAVAVLAVQLVAWTRTAGVLLAQQPQPAGCSFDRCGLLVVAPTVAVGRSTTGERRTVSWMFVPHIPELEAAGQPSQLEYRRAERLYRRSSIVEAAGIPAFLGLIYYVSVDPQKRPWRAPLERGVVGIAVSTTLLDAPIAAHAAEHLSRAAWAYSRPAGPQLPDSTGCTYDRCALRFAYSAWSSALARGLDGAPVASPRELFANAGDSVRAHYERYLALRHGARWTGAFVLTSLVCALAALHPNDPTVRGIGAGFLFAGYAVGHMSFGTVAREHQELEAAVWEYNRALVK
jgi:hypothetical protein